MYPARESALTARLVRLPGGEQARVVEGKVELTVRDHGAGVPRGLEQQLFERFVRGAQGKGVGLGLAIVKGIVTAHGGTVSVSNASGGGAAFVVSLPLTGERP